MDKSEDDVIDQVIWAYGRDGSPYSATLEALKLKKDLMEALTIKDVITALDRKYMEEQRRSKKKKGKGKKKEKKVLSGGSSSSEELTAETKEERGLAMRAERRLEPQWRTISNQWCQPIQSQPGYREQMEFAGVVAEQGGFRYQAVFKGKYHYH